MLRSTTADDLGSINYDTLTSWDGYWFEDRLNGCSGITSAALRGSVDCTAPASLLAARRGSYRYKLAEYGYRISDYCFAPRGAIYCLTSDGLYWIPGDRLRRGSVVSS